jgi:hypothetical protein
VAYKAAKEFIQKYGKDNDQYAQFAQKFITAYENVEAQKKVQARVDRYTNAAKAKNHAEVFASARDWLAADPTNAYPVLAPIDYGYGLATSNPPVNDYNEQTIASAKQAIQRIESGNLNVPDWKVYNYKNKDDALAFLNYMIGRITFVNMTGKEADAVPFFYKSLQYQSDIKTTEWLPYYALGFKYRADYNKAVTDFQKKSEGVTELTDELKLGLATNNAIADRAIDAFARAYKIAKDSPKLPQSVKDARRKDLEEVYKARNKNQTTGLDALVASVMTKPLPDPTSPVTPVIEDTTTTTGATGTTTPAAIVPSTTKTTTVVTSSTGTTTRPRTTETPAATTGAAAKSSSTNTTTTTTTKPVATKPAPRKVAPKKPSRK